MKQHATEMSKSKDAALGFLQRAGIIDKRGHLARQYRD